MDKYREPTFNFFTSSGLKRHAEKRPDGEWILKRAGEDNTRIAVLSNLKLLYTGEPARHAVYFSLKDFSDIQISSSQFIYLGEKDGIHYFCVDISDYPAAIKSFSDKGRFVELRSIAPFIDREEAAVQAYARALVYWHKNHKYCGVCGSITASSEAGHKLVCTNPGCKAENFPRTDPAVIMLVEKNGKCLLARQAKWPRARYSTIAGYVEPGESFEQAVQREVLEETGVIIGEIKYHSSQPWPFPAAVMVGFRAEAVSDEIYLGDRELEDARWFSREEITEGINNGSLVFPPPISVSFQLIRDWFDEESPVPLPDSTGGKK